jgi:acetylornithine deacetylase
VTAASDRTIQILRELVGFDTTSRESNLDLIAYAESILDEAGFATRRILSPDGSKANLFASAGPDRPDGLILSGHSDCVPVDGQRWSTPPFELTPDEDGRWFGRGTADMKGFLASMLAAASTLDVGSLARPLHVALSHDEETGGDGARRMVDALKEIGITARACIVGEPTSMRVVTEHKGIFVFDVAVVGTPAHSSLAPRAVNAIDEAARLVVFLRDLAIERAEHGPFVDGYDVTHTTLHVGRISGGTALNIVPKHCTFEFEFRHLPDDDPAGLIATIEAEVARLRAGMQAVSAEAGISMTLQATLPHLSTADDAAIVEWLRGLTGTGPGKVAYGTEAGLIAEGWNVPTVVCGPGAIDQAHARDEYVLDSQLAECDRLMDRLIADLGA